MKTLLKYLKNYRKECVLAPLFKLLEAVFELLVPLIVAAMIDKGIGGHDPDAVWRYGLILLALAAVGLVSAITAQLFAARAATGFAARLKNALIRHIYALSFKQTDEVGVPTLITRMTGDVNQVQTGVNLTLRLLLRSPFIVLGALVMALIVDGGAGLIFVAVIPALSLCVTLVMRRTLPGYKAVARASDGTLETVRENLTGVRVIRAFSREEDERARFKAKHAALTGLQLKTQAIASLLNPLTLILVDGALAALIYVGALKVNIGVLTQGQVVALTNYMAQILVELIKLANLLVTLSRSLASASRLESVLLTKPDEMSGSEAPDWAARPLVRFENASLSYQAAGRDALSRVTLTLNPGETLGVIGGTGSGKSTFAALIPGFYPATGGRVLVGGRDVRELDKKALRERIAVVPQQPRLFSGTIRDNLLMGDRSATDEALYAALETAQAADFVRARKEGLDALVEQGGRNFSGGQRQRLTIARALVHHSDILILDDSASALDAKTDAALQNALKLSMKNTALVVISQRASSVMGLDRILVLDEGRVVGLATHEELMKTCPVYIETYEAQFPKEAAQA